MAPLNVLTLTQVDLMDPHDITTSCECVTVVTQRETGKIMIHQNTLPCDLVQKWKW